MKEFFVEKRFQGASLEKIATANKIIDQYLGAGLKLTLRQLYYQFVAHHGLPNTERSYKGLASLISDARLAGLVDWDAIEDRGRVPQRAGQWDGIPSLMESALRAYRRDRWEHQPTYAELWVEKQALAGVLEPMSHEFHVTLMVNKGYSSQSAMKEAAERYRDQTDREELILFYLGDHDPSGEDMVRDIGDRLDTFGVDVRVEKLALTMTQIKQYNPPPNPAKVTDARFAAYAAKHGDQSWEVDALDPDTLQEIIREAFDGVIDRDAMDHVIEREGKEKAALVRAVKEIKWEKFE